MVRPIVFLWISSSLSESPVGTRTVMGVGLTAKISGPKGSYDVKRTSLVLFARKLSEKKKRLVDKSHESFTLVSPPKETLVYSFPGPTG